MGCLSRGPATAAPVVYRPPIRADAVPARPCPPGRARRRTPHLASGSDQTTRTTAAPDAPPDRTVRMRSAFQRFSARPAPEGLYDGEHEHDACGVAFVATMRGAPGHDIVEHALTALRNLDHRGAVGAEPDTGDGAGILTQVPDAFLREVAGFDLPARRRLRRRHWSSCRRTTRRPPRPWRASSASRPRRASACSAGVTCPPRTPWSARSPAGACRASRRSSSPATRPR